MTEFELKFEIPPANLQRVEAAQKKGTRSKHLQATYFDTQEGTLAAHGLAVRIRKEGRRWVQTAKGPTSTLLERLEHSVTLAQQSGGAQPGVDLARHAGTPVGKAISQALKLQSGKDFFPLIPLYKTDIQRVARLVEHGGSVMDISLDQGRILSGTKSLGLCELEVELKKGQPADAVALARQWCAEFGLSLSTITKSIKGQRLRDTDSAGPAVCATALAFHPVATGAQIVAAVLQSCLTQILPNASEVAAGSCHPDHVHQLRVGLRRLRTALRELEGLADAFDPLWQPTLADVFRQLGRYRDHGYLEHDLQPQLLMAGGPSVDFGQASTDIPDPGAVVRTPGFQDVLLGLIGFTHKSGSQVSKNKVSGRSVVKKVLRSRLKKLHSQALKKGEKFTGLNETDQHRVRKRLKRLRYLSEFSAPLFKAREVNAFIAALKPTQDALGVYHDELMALQAYRKLAIESQNAWFGIGWLTARIKPNAQLWLNEIETLVKVRPFWD